MEKLLLKSLYEEVRDLSFPKFSSNEELSNWIEDLIEIDAYYAGLALSIAEGAKITKENLPDLKPLRSTLEQIQSNIQNTDNKNLENIADCYHYLEKIQNIHQILKQLTS